MLVPFRRELPQDHIRDIGEHLGRVVTGNRSFQKLRRGDSVAVCVGSRGIARLQELVSTFVSLIRERGCRPYVVPAMGSHGNATSDGQKDVLSQLGITEETCGCEIRTSMDVVQIGATNAGTPVVVDRQAAAADHIVPINRVKPHTDYFGPIQSGITKMLAVGLGNHQGAQTYHGAFRMHGFTRTVTEVAGIVTSKLSVPFGIAVVENERHQVLNLEVLGSRLLVRDEKRLLRIATDRMADLPQLPIDLLIIDQMGKSISGSGFDTNVLGLKKPDRIPNAPHLYVRTVVGGGGNAIGIGLADYVHGRVLSQIDWDATYANALAAGSPRGAALPVCFQSDAVALEQIAKSLGKRVEQLAILRIRDTMNLEVIYASEHLKNRLGSNWVRAQGFPTTFLDSGGNMSPDLTGRVEDKSEMGSKTTVK